MFLEPENFCVVPLIPKKLMFNIVPHICLLVLPFYS